MTDMASAPFVYEEAFDRNIGWVTTEEQANLRTRRVAIAGLGGVGGIHLLTLARLGIGAFNIADFDRFTVANINRQVGATIETIGRPKLEVVGEMALAVNPELDLRCFPYGIHPANIDEFLSNVDLFVDGVDFFALDIRQALFARAYELGIPALTAAPIGMGVGFLAFLPGKMTFEQYFRLDGQTESERYLRFLIGLTPKGIHRSYLADPTRVDLAGKRGPSTAAACQLCAGVTASVALRLLLNRHGVRAAPFHLQFDGYTGRLATSRLWFGNNGPIQRVRLFMARRMLSRLPRVVKDAGRPTRPIEQVLQHGRWAPSGDNAQPWRFQILNDLSAEVDFKAGDHGDIYDFRSHEPTTLSAGMLLETLLIAARHLGWSLQWELEGSSKLTIKLCSAPLTPIEKLFPFIPIRSVNRRSYRRRALRANETLELEAALGSELAIDWYPDPRQRRRIARLGAAATSIRLRAAAAYDVHRRVIDWAVRDSPVGIPAEAVGVDRLTLRLMRWTLKSWRRVCGLNRILGTGAIELQLDLLPGWRSAAFFTLRQCSRPEDGLERTRSLLRAGQHIQRFWLTATRLGLAMQPAYATLIFAHYGEHPGLFTAEPSLQARAERLASAFHQAFGAAPDDILFIGRIGEPIPGPVRGRSIRRSLAQLSVTATPPSAVP